MIRVNQLGRLGGSLVPDLTFDASANMYSDEPPAPAADAPWYEGGGFNTSTTPPGADVPFTPSNKVVGNMSLFGNEEKTVVANQTNAAPDAGKSWWDVFDRGTNLAQQVVTTVGGQPVVAPPPPPVEQGMAGSTIVLIGFGLVALLGVGYAVLSD